MQSSASLLWYVSGGLLGLVGILFFVRGVSRRFRRRGDTPYCRECGYNLIGLTGERCPECGAVISPDMIIFGEGYRRPGLMWVGGICLVIALFLCVGGVSRLQRINWYQYYPTGWIMNDLRSSGRAIVRKAWRELDLRHQKNTLTAAQQSRLIDICLEAQATDPACPSMQTFLEHLGQCYLNEQLSKQQERTFFQQMIHQVEYVVRPWVIAEKRIPSEIRCKTRRPRFTQCSYTTKPCIQFKMSIDEIWLNEKRIYKRNHKSSMSWQGPGATMNRKLPPQPPGHYQVRVIPNIEVLFGPSNDAKARKVMYAYQEPVSTSFDVLAEEPPGYIKMIKDPSMIEALKASIELKYFRYSQGEIRGMIEVKKSLPANVAFETTIMAGQNKIRSLTIASSRQSRMGYHFSHDYEDSPPEDVDIIFRSSKAVAQSTVNLFEIWDGELVYKNVPVRIEKQEQ